MVDPRLPPAKPDFNENAVFIIVVFLGLCMIILHKSYRINLWGVRRSFIPPFLVPVFHSGPCACRGLAWVPPLSCFVFVCLLQLVGFAGIGFVASSARFVDCSACILMKNKYRGGSRTRHPPPPLGSSL